MSDQPADGRRERPHDDAAKHRHLCNVIRVLKSSFWFIFPFLFLPPSFLSQPVKGCVQDISQSLPMTIKTHRSQSKFSRYMYSIYCCVCFFNNQSQFIKGGTILLVLAGCTRLDCPGTEEREGGGELVQTAANFRQFPPGLQHQPAVISCRAMTAEGRGPGANNSLYLCLALSFEY